MKSNEILLFVNPTAGRGRAKKVAKLVGAKFQEEGIGVETVDSQAEGDLEEKVFGAAKSGVTSIVVAGGDGSVHEAVNGILQSATKSALGIVPLGTGNDFAKAVYGTSDWRHVAHTIAMRIKEGSPNQKIDVGRMNERYFANGAGIGFDAKINTMAKKYRWPIGSLVYLFAVIEGLWDGVITPTVTIRSKAFEYNGPITLANVSNGPWVGGLFRIAPMARINDGLFDLVIASPMSRSRLFLLIPKLLQGSHIGEPGVQQLTIESFSLSSTEPLPSHLDGEVQPMQTTFDIRVLNNALRII